MTTIVKMVLSDSTDGRGIKVAATATPGTAIHTAHATAEDELWLWAVNSESVDRKLTIEWGGVSVPDDLIEYTVPAEDGLHLVVPGIILSNTLLVKAFAAVADVIIIHGYVNRITP